eukprot:jgi/Chrpa1/7272/Chrysochromulina_OHIO_Genome00009761-RA
MRRSKAAAAPEAESSPPAVEMRLVSDLIFSKAASISSSVGCCSERPCTTARPRAAPTPKPHCCG